VSITNNFASEASLPAINPSELKEDQFRAYNIILWHLEQTLANKRPPPLQMIIYGEGGTGKSKVIQTVTEAFVQKGVKYMLLKSAYTGIAASLINGKTTYVIGHISLNAAGKISNKAKAKLQQFWKHYTYLIIDEYSMIGKAFLALLSQSVDIGQGGTEINSHHHSFSRVNVVLCGDLHQFPPVATKPTEALYHPINPISNNTESLLGQKIYEEFTMVIILKQQMRVTDKLWRDFLVHLRHGCMQDKHINMLKAMVISKPNQQSTDFTSEDWANMSLVTP